MTWTYLDNQMPIYDFGHLQRVNWGQSQTKNSNFGYCKNLSFSKSLIWRLYNYEDYLWSKFQLNLTLFTRVIAPKNPPKWAQLGPEPNKTFKNNKYPEAEIWYPESIEVLYYYSLGQNFL